MDIKEILKNKIIENPIAQNKIELTNIISSKKINNELNEDNAILGLKLLDIQNLDIYKKTDSSYLDYKNIFNISIWSDENKYNLLKFIFKEMAPYIKYAWGKLPGKMYSIGYHRRSFRAPFNELNIFELQIAFFNSLLYFSRYDIYSKKEVFFDLTLEEQIKYDSYITNSTEIYLIWAAAIDMGNHQVYQLIEDIIYQKETVGKITDNIIKALLNCEDKKCWLLVEKLLLSAQRQEGLRQSIVESLDYANTQAFQFMIQVILDNDLLRFSSVVRAVGTWTGLAWEVEKVSIIKNMLKPVLQYFVQPELIPEAIKSKNNNEVYMALWSLGVSDIEKTIPYLQTLLQSKNIEKKCLALLFINNFNFPELELPLYHQAVTDNNLQVLSLVLTQLINYLDRSTKPHLLNNEFDYNVLFNKLFEINNQITEKDQSFSGKVFAWNNSKFEKKNLLHTITLLSFNNKENFEKIIEIIDILPSEAKASIAKNSLSRFCSFSNFYVETSSSIEKPSTDDVDLAIKLLKDKDYYLIETSFNVIKEIDLDNSQADCLIDILKTKDISYKNRIIHLISKQSDEVIEYFIEELLNKNIDYKLSALELMLFLKNENRFLVKIASWANSYKNKANLNKKETQLLAQLGFIEDKIILSESNGYGFYDVNSISNYQLPENNQDGVFFNNLQINQYGFSVSLDKIKLELNKLENILNQYENYEYSIENWDKTVTTVILSNDFQKLKYSSFDFTNIENFNNLPLIEVWEKWYLESNLQPVDLYLLSFINECSDNDWKSFLEKYYFFYNDFSTKPFDNSKFYYHNPIEKICKTLIYKYVFEQRTDFLIDACSHFFANLPSEVISYKIEDKYNNRFYTIGNDTIDNGWQSLDIFSRFLNAASSSTGLTAEQKTKLWHLYRWRQLTGLPENRKQSTPPMYLFLHAYEHQLITKEEVYEGLLSSHNIRDLTSSTKNFFRVLNQTELTEIPSNHVIQIMLDDIRETFVDIEVNRSELNTNVTEILFQFKKFYGINRLIQFVNGLGELSFSKSFTWGQNAWTKQKIFSFLIKHCYPSKTDTFELFSQAIKAEKLTSEKLIQIAIYAPQWQKFISQYLDWNGLDEGIWWLHAHTKTTSDNIESAVFESEVAKYSVMNLQDFSNGGVDKSWFDSVYKKLGKTKWEILYDSAKFISDGNGHKRAKIYSDVLTGDLKIRDVSAKVKDKRDQDYLRVYGLVPLSKTNPQKDVLSRYEYLQQFNKQSKEFGAMKQASEALAVQVALENLARNAGYADPIRLTWAMENQQVKSILSKETEVTLEGITVGLEIDAEGKANIFVSKDNKLLKSVPAKIKKDKKIHELESHKKTLREQWSRSKKGLEDMMLRGENFLASELTELFEHPVIAKHLEKLVFISSDNQLGFYKNGYLVNPKTDQIVIQEQQQFRIAHCYDLHINQVWTDFQNYCFTHQLQQPFKQVFRELYIPTQDELNEKAISRRYAGHQVQPKQTLALLKSRGWKVDYEEGLQKVFHQQGFKVKLYAMADWFSPADVESPVLETIEFHSLKDFKNIPFDTICPRIFSEVMRDIDLVVSVAHVGGVDPEASHSSIQMRAALLTETAKLFKLNNIEVKGSHAIIKGSLAQYSLHLGSAVVHQMPGKYLSILPVHSQHRGKVFLPFVDDDPKSAEIMSKAILLAKDQEIQDPTILSQILR